jgi:transcriptional regulator with XRE-family HTH domain
MITDNLLGDFLRARRELVQPASVGIPIRGVRRVNGLRREEVAMLAGVSTDYYLRLEQGRDHNPSIQVLEALAGVLQLDQTAPAPRSSRYWAPWPSPPHRRSGKIARRPRRNPGLPRRRLRTHDRITIVAGDGDERFRFAVDVVIEGIVARAASR